MGNFPFWSNCTGVNWSPILRIIPLQILTTSCLLSLDIKMSVKSIPSLKTWFLNSFANNANAFFDAVSDAFSFDISKFLSAFTAFFAVIGNVDAASFQESSRNLIISALFLLSTFSKNAFTFVLIFGVASLPAAILFEYPT